MTTTHPSPTPATTTTVLDPGQHAARFAETMRQLRSLDVATSIKQAARHDACLLADSVSPDYAPDDADIAIEGHDPMLVAELNATLLYLAEHGPAMAFAFRTVFRSMARIEEAVEGVFGIDVADGVRDGLRVTQRMRAAYALADQVLDAHPDNLDYPDRDRALKGK